MALIQLIEWLGKFQIIPSMPFGLSTRWISLTDSALENQWKHWAARAASAELLGKPKRTIIQPVSHSEETVYLNTKAMKSLVQNISFLSVFEGIVMYQGCMTSKIPQVWSLILNWTTKEMSQIIILGFQNWILGNYFVK